MLTGGKDGQGGVSTVCIYDNPPPPSPQTRTRPLVLRLFQMNFIKRNQKHWKLNKNSMIYIQNNINRLQYKTIKLKTFNRITM